MNHSFVFLLDPDFQTAADLPTFFQMFTRNLKKSPAGPVGPVKGPNRVKLGPTWTKPFLKFPLEHFHRTDELPNFLQFLQETQHVQWAYLFIYHLSAHQWLLMNHILVSIWIFDFQSAASNLHWDSEGNFWVELELLVFFELL